MIRSLVVTVILFVGLATPVPALADGDRPNVILIIADDLTYTDLGFAGNDEVRTPHLDKLRGESVYLQRLFTTAPMCAPTRMSIYTGLYPVRNGAHPNHSRVLDDVQSLPNYLLPLGYRVGLTGKRHYAPETNFPFDFLGGRQADGGPGNDLDLEAADEFINASDDPFCLVLASNQPHTPWNLGDSSHFDAATLTLPPYLVDTERTRSLLADYYAEIEYLDNQVGKAMAMLEASGEAGNTVVIFVSEQGSNFPHAKWTLYDTGIRAAGLVRWPDVVESGSSSTALASYVDLLPTIFELAGGDPAELDIDGRSLVNLLRGETAAHRDVVFAVQTSRGIIRGPDHYGIRAARDGSLKYIRNLTPDATFKNTVTAGQAGFGSWRKAAEAGDEVAAERVKAYQHRPAEELYDLEADPFEMHNVINDPKYAESLEKLRKSLDEWMQQQGDEGQATEMDALNRQAKE